MWATSCCPPVVCLLEASTIVAGASPIQSPGGSETVVEVKERSQLGSPIVRVSTRPLVRQELLDSGEAPKALESPDHPLDEIGDRFHHLATTSSAPASWVALSTPTQKFSQPTPRALMIRWPPKSFLPNPPDRLPNLPGEILA